MRENPAGIRTGKGTFVRMTAVLLPAAALVLSMTLTASGTNAQTPNSVYGLTDAGKLVAFDPANPTLVNATVAIGGDTVSGFRHGVS